MKKYIFNCEGTLWKEQSFFNKNKNSLTHKKYKTFWCRGGTCTQKNDEINLDLPFEKWTINEIGHIFSFSPNLDISTFFAGWVNRRNELLERLECRECKSALKPKLITYDKIPWYSVPLFHCINKQCSIYQKEIRITHCCNGNCHGSNLTIIDSRDSPQCKNKWLVCQDCYACCNAHHDNQVISCFKCGEELNDKSLELGKTVWECNCGIVIEDYQVESLKRFWEKPMFVQRRDRNLEKGLGNI